MPYDAVIFDLDGTLLDTLADLANSMNRVLRAHGFPPHPENSYRYFVGQGMASLARAALPAPADAAMQEILAALRAQNLPLAVFSNKPDNFTQVVVRRFFPEHMFAHIQGAKEGVAIKPDPAGALAIAAALHLPPERIVYVGDTDTDMRTGVAAGMFTVGVEWGFRPEQLHANGAHAVIAHPMELLALLPEK